MARTLASIIATIIEVEGGYVNHPNDRGGPTMWGITEATARAYGYAGAMERMPKQIAEAIYQDRYWLQPKFDQVARLDEPLAVEMMDCGVNMGQTLPVRFLQRALNVMNKRSKTWPDMKVDGLIGPMTLFALSNFLKERGEEGRAVIRRAVDSQQLTRYIEIAENDPKQEDFVYGQIAHRTGA